jgi:hypothetical protein
LREAHPAAFLWRNTEIARARYWHAVEFQGTAQQNGLRHTCDAECRQHFRGIERGLTLIGKEAIEKRHHRCRALLERFASNAGNARERSIVDQGRGRIRRPPVECQSQFDRFAQAFRVTRTQVETGNTTCLGASQFIEYGRR